jgi:hypothetical protein
MRKEILFLLTFIFLIFQTSYGSDYPRVDFKRYETAHQILYFSSNLDESVISRLIKEAETSENFIKNLYGWVPDKKIITVYDRETDTANGWSRSYLKNTIMLYMFPPSRYSTLSSYKSWEQGLHVHEYTHSTQIGMTKGFPKFVNRVFGNLYFPGGMIPLWMIEGVAIYSESLISGKGRLNSPLYQAYFDSFFLKGNQFSLGQISGIPDHWMVGGALYLYGTFFYDYLINRYSSEVMSQMFVEMSDDVIPVAIISTAIKSALKEKPTTLYNDFIEKNRKRVLKERTTSSGINKFPEKFQSVFVDLNSNGYVVRGSSIGETGIYRYNKKEKEFIVSIPSSDSFSLSNEKLLFPSTFNIDDRYTRKDVVFADLTKRTTEKITKNGSVIETVFGKNKDVFYISFTDGINRITRINMEGHKLNEWEFPMLNSIYSMSITDDGNAMVFTGNRHGHEKNIFLFDIQSGELFEINIEGEQYSVYFHQDSELVFSTGKKGLIAPYHLDLRNGKLTQLYRPQLIALFPKIIENDLFFISFDNDGYYPAWYPIENIEAGIVSETDVVKITERHKPVQIEGLELKSGKFYDGLFPSVIIPDYRGSTNTHTIGFAVEGESNDLQRFYTLHLSKTFGSVDRWFTSFNYFDKYILPGFRLYFSYSRDSSTLDKMSDINKVSNRFNTGFSVSGSFNGLFHISPSKIIKSSNYLRVSLGISALDEQISQSTDPLTVSPKEKDRLSLTASFSYGISFPLNPGSYFIFGDVERFSLSLPFVLQKSLFDDFRAVTFTPETKLSFLVLRNGKLGFVTKHSLYLRFLSDSFFSLGGHELGMEMLDIKSILLGSTGSTVTVRGYNYGAMAGKNVYYTNNELRFHIFSINKGFGTVPLMFKNIQGALFYDMGIASNDINLFNKQFIAGVGGELKLYLFFIYRVPMMLTFGMSKGLTTKGTYNWYFNFGNSF